MADNGKKRETSTGPEADAASNVASFAATGRGKPCPICGRQSTVEMRPFCSKRCADIDLGRWLGEVYRVPSGDPAPTDESDPVASENPGKKP